MIKGDLSVIVKERAFLLAAYYSIYSGAQINVMLLLFKLRVESVRWIFWMNGLILYGSVSEQSEDNDSVRK